MALCSGEALLRLKANPQAQLTSAVGPPPPTAFGFRSTCVSACSKPPSLAGRAQTRGHAAQALSAAAASFAHPDAETHGPQHTPMEDESFPPFQLRNHNQPCPTNRALLCCPTLRQPFRLTEAPCLGASQEDESFPPACQASHLPHARIGQLRHALPSPSLSLAAPDPAGAGAGPERAISVADLRAELSAPASAASPRDHDEASWGSSHSDRAHVAPYLATLQPEVPFEYVTFDIVRGPLIHFLPHGSGPEEAVLHAVRHAPFPNPTWTRPRAHVPDFPQFFPQFQLLLVRDPATITVILDQRPLEGDVLVAETGYTTFTGEQFASSAPVARRTPAVAQVVRASQLVLYHNHRPWALAYAVSLLTGDLICFACRSGSFLRVGRDGLQWQPFSGALAGANTPLIIARVGLAGHGCAIGTAPGPHLLLALARALRELLQELPHLNNLLLAASPLQDAACGTYREVRFMATTQVMCDEPTVWLDRRPMGGSLQVPSCLHAEDLHLFDSALSVDLSGLRDVAATHTGSTLQQSPLGHQGNVLVPVADLFHLEGMRALSAWGRIPPLRLAATFGPDFEIAASLRDWVIESSMAFRLDAEGSRVRVFAPGCSLTTVISFSPPTVSLLAEHVGEWLQAHYGPGVLFDCQLAAGDVCLFAFIPNQVSNIFAGAVQFVHRHPLFRLVSRGALHHTPAGRLRFLTFQTDAANTLAIPVAADSNASSGSSRGTGTAARTDAGADSGDPVSPFSEDDRDTGTGISLLQTSAQVSRRLMSVPHLPPGQDMPKQAGGGPVFARLSAIPSPLRCRSFTAPSPSDSHCRPLQGALRASLHSGGALPGSHPDADAGHGCIPRGMTCMPQRSLEDESFPPRLAARSASPQPLADAALILSPNPCISGAGAPGGTSRFPRRSMEDESFPPRSDACTSFLSPLCQTTASACTEGDESCPPAFTIAAPGDRHTGDEPLSLQLCPTISGGSFPCQAFPCQGMHNGRTTGDVPYPPSVPDAERHPTQCPAPTATRTLQLASTLAESSPVRDLASLLHSMSLWGNSFWQPVQQLNIPRWIRKLLPSGGCPSTQSPTAFHVYTDGSADNNGAGWGAVLVAEYHGPPYRQAIAFAGRNISASGCFASFSAQTNNAAEAWALLATQIAALALPVQLPLTFWVDSCVTLGSATGQTDPARIRGDPALSCAVRASAQILQQRPAPTQWRWVPGHSGFGFNELADLVAGLAARDRIASPLSRSLQRLAGHALLPWAWRLLARTQAVPPLEQLAVGQYETPDHLPRACVQAIVDDAQLPPCKSAESLPCRLLTANLCTGAGKQVPLMAQLDAARVDVAFFQETRARFSRQCHGRWMQFCAAAERGRGGCSIWIRQGWSLGTRPVVRTDCTVLLAQADIIAVRVKVTDCSILLVNLHGPHSQRPQQEISDWWFSTAAQVRTLQDDDFLIVGGDYNARLGPSSDCTGEHGPDLCDEAGSHVARFCAEFHLFLANTYCEVMGDHRAATWKDRRLDYIAVPACCLCTCKVVPLDFDLLNPHEDHRALCLDLAVWGSGALPTPRPPPKPGRCTATSRVRAGRDHSVALDALSALAQSDRDWADNVHSHADAIFQQAQRLLDTAPSQGAYPNKPFTSPSAMAFIQQRKYCDRFLRMLDGEERLLALKRCFRAWCLSLRGHSPVAGVDQSRLHHARAVCLKARAIWCKCVRHQLRVDKAEYVEGLCAELHDAASRKDSAALFARLRYFRPASKRVLKPFGPLDILRRADGCVAGSFEEQQCVRGRHFGAMEAALVQSAAEFAQGDSPPTPPSEGYRLEQLPSLLDLEQVVRCLPRRKAPGPSGVPNEVWKASPATAASLWLPVVLKQHVRLTEPARFSTGILATLFKGKGDPSCVGSHRSIFLLEGLGKACRKMVRLPVLDALRSASPDLFEGCQPGSSSGTLTHYVASFRDFHHLKGWSTFCLFIDLSSAYYRVLRAKVTDEDWTDASICHVFGTDGGLFRPL